MVRWWDTGRIFRGATIATLLCLGGSLPALPKYFYSADFSARTGLMFYGTDPGFLNGQQQTLDNDFFFKDRNDISANNVNTTPAEYRMVNMTVQFELSVGIVIDKLPGLKNIQSLKGFKGIHGGISAQLAPFSTRSAFTYNGPIRYVVPGGYAGGETEHNYNGRVSVRDDIFVFMPAFALYYYHEKGVNWFNGIDFMKGRDAIPYAGFDFGLGFANGNRNYILDTDPITFDTDGAGPDPSATYRMTGKIQENYFNAMGYRFSIIHGWNIHLGGPNFFEFRVGYTIQRFNGDLTRRGGVTETEDRDGNFSYTYTDGVNREVGSTRIDQSGFFFTLGYTRALL